MSTAAPAPPATRQVLLTVWCPRVGEFMARVVLADGSLRDFDCPFELVRFLATPPVPPAGTSGLR
jgi:hypothetical protein